NAPGPCAEGTPAAASRAAAVSMCRRRARERSRAAAASVSTGGQPVGFVHFDGGADQCVQVTVEYVVQVVGLITGAVVGDAVLGEVIGADPFAAVHGAHLGAAHLGHLRFGFLLLFGPQPRAQHAHGLFAALQLGLLVLHRHHDAGGLMRDPYGGLGGAHALSAGPGGTVDVDAQVIRGDLDLAGVLHLGEHQHPGRRGVDPALRFGDRHALDAVDSTLVLQVRPYAVVRIGTTRLDRQGDVLE